MGRVPGHVTAGGAAVGAVGVAHPNRPLGAARVVLAGVVGGVGVGSAIGLRAGQDVVLIGGFADALDRFALFGQIRPPMHIVAKLTEFHGVAVQMGDVVGHDGAIGIGPRSLADAVAGVDGGLVAVSLSAQIGAPGPVAGADGAGQFLAMGVGAGQSAQIGALADTATGDEEAQRGVGGFCGGHCAGGVGAQNEQADKKTTTPLPPPSWDNRYNRFQAP